MSQPAFVGETHASASGVSSLTLTRSCAGLNTLVLGVALANGSQSVSGITDSAGSVLGVPVNNWQPIGGNTFGGIRLEYWACRGITAITALTIHLTGSQFIVAAVAEFSGVSAFGVTRGFQVNASDNPHTNEDLVLNVTEQAISNQIMVTFFTEGFLDALTSTLVIFGDAQEGSERFLVQPSGSLPGLCMVEQGVANANNLFDTEVAVAALATAANLSACNLQAITLLLSGGLTLRSQPGFCDIPDSAFAAGQTALGINLAKISENAEFGMVRLEMFYGTYTDGDTVNLPVSTVDDYQYGRDELLYIWVPVSSVNAANGWASAQEALWYCNWQVDQWQGALSPGGGVHCEEWYTYIHGSRQTRTNDGILGVWTIAQRRFRDLIIASPPSYSPIADTSFAQNNPLTQAIAQQLNQNAKFAVVAVEAVYMGEFIDAQTVPQPISPVDGYIYPYANCIFVYCWRWTNAQTSYAAPKAGHFLLGVGANINASGLVHCFTSQVEVGVSTSSAADGRIAVFAICSRPVSGTPFALGNDFSEVDLTSFLPGGPLSYELLKQINDNTQESISVPETFTHYNVANAYTVPLPVSPRDGYKYVRSECFYLWMLRTTDPPSTDRIIIFQDYVDQSTGVATIQECRLPHGGVGTFYNDGAFDIVVIAIRSGTGRVPTTAASTTFQNPVDLTTPPQGGVAGITVNGT